jgi:hypothetical protein
VLVTQNVMANLVSYRETLKAFGVLTVDGDACCFTDPQVAAIEAIQWLRYKP